MSMEDQTLFKEQPLLPDGPFDQLLILAGPAPDSGASLAEAGGCRIFKIYLGENNVLGQVNNAFIRAAAQRNHLLVVWAGVQIDFSAAAVLEEATQQDPYFGFAFPRLLRTSDGALLPVPLQGMNLNAEALPRRALSELKPYYIVLEHTTPCFLITDRILANLGLLDESYLTLPGAFLEYLCRARRVGYRGIVVNSAAAYVAEGSCAAAVEIGTADRQRLIAQHPESAWLDQRADRQPFVLEERLLSKVYPNLEKQRRTLAIDAADLPASFNDTVDAALLLLDGVHKAARGWEVTILCRHETGVFHKLQRRYPNFKLLTPETDQTFTALFRINQPWSVSHLVQAHRRAFFNIVTILDTIAWDIQYMAPSGLTEAWEFSANYLDGIVYDSVFTADRFRCRFPLGPGVKECAQLYSLRFEEYRQSTRAAATTGDYILMVGNSFDHKDLRASTTLLADAFPYEQFKVLGLKHSDREQVQALASGHLEEQQIHDLFAGAKLVVFPSFYEGFGFPLVRGLAYGKPVVVRDLALYREVAENCRGEGKIYLFSTPLELFEKIGRLLHGQSLPALPLGGALQAEEPAINWETAAHNILLFIEEICTAADLSHWRQRDRVVRLRVNGE